jgi:hypothetical protein
MKTTKPLILLLGVLLVAGCSPSLTEAERTATQEALVSSTPTLTNTPTVTHTLPPTLTPTATPVPVVAEPQEDGTTLVKVVVDGFQFVLPAGWEYQPPGSDPDPDWRTGASLEIPSSSNISLDVSMVDTRRDLEAFLERLATQYTVLEFTVLRQDVTTNRQGVPIAVLEVQGDFGPVEGVHNYHIVMQLRGQIVMLSFGGNLNLARNAIMAIQDSIQLID